MRRISSVSTYLDDVSQLPSPNNDYASVGTRTTSDKNKQPPTDGEQQQNSVGESERNHERTMSSTQNQNEIVSTRIQVFSSLKTQSTNSSTDLTCSSTYQSMEGQVQSTCGGNNKEIKQIPPNNESIDVKHSSKLHRKVTSLSVGRIKLTVSSQGLWVDVSNSMDESNGHQLSDCQHAEWLGCWNPDFIEDNSVYNEPVLSSNPSGLFHDDMQQMDYTNLISALRKMIDTEKIEFKFS